MILINNAKRESNPCNYASKSVPSVPKWNLMVKCHEKSPSIRPKSLLATYDYHWTLRICCVGKIIKAHENVKWIMHFQGVAPSFIWVLHSLVECKRNQQSLLYLHQRDDSPWWDGSNISHPCHIVQNCIKIQFIARNWEFIFNYSLSIGIQIKEWNQNS